MISFYNQLNFDLFITTLPESELFKAALDYKSLLHVTGFTQTEKRKLFTDLQYIENELTKRKQTTL